MVEGAKIGREKRGLHNSVVVRHHSKLYIIGCAASNNLMYFRPRNSHQLIMKTCQHCIEKSARSSKNGKKSLKTLCRELMKNEDFHEYSNSG